MAIRIISAFVGLVTGGLAGLFLIVVTVLAMPLPWLDMLPRPHWVMVNLVLLLPSLVAGIIGFVWGPKLLQQRAGSTR